MAIQMKTKEQSCN